MQQMLCSLYFYYYFSRFQKAIRESGAGELAKSALYAYVQDDELQDWARAIMAKLGIKLDLVGFDCCCVCMYACIYVCMHTCSMHVCLYVCI
jgi:hypothetical protein